MSRYYIESEMSRLYSPGDTMSFSRGVHCMATETDAKFTWGLVEPDCETGKYRRASSDPGIETMLINETKLCDRLEAGVYLSSPWSTSTRPK